MDMDLKLSRKRILRWTNFFNYWNFAVPGERTSALAALRILAGTRAIALGSRTIY